MSITRESEKEREEGRESAERRKWCKTGVEVRARSLGSRVILSRHVYKQNAKPPGGLVFRNADPPAVRVVIFSDQWLYMKQRYDTRTPRTLASVVTRE